MADARIDALGPTDDGVMLGTSLGDDFNLGALGVLGAGVDVRYDVADHIGGLITLRANALAPFDRGAWIVAIAPELTFASADYMRASFGVSAPDAAQSGLPAFDAGAGFKDAAIAVAVTHDLRGSFSITGMARCALLIGDAADSPVTVSEDQLFGGGLMLNYGF